MKRTKFYNSIILIIIAIFAIVGMFALPIPVENTRTDTSEIQELASNIVRYLIRTEADYIVSCQYINSGFPGNGCMNNVYGDPTWIVPRENALAMLALLKASDVLRDVSLKNKAEFTSEFLINAQESDGSWLNQYGVDSTGNIVRGDINDVDNCNAFSKSPTQTAEVIYALSKLRKTTLRYNAIMNGAEFLLQCQDPVNKQGIDDGLICGGQDERGNWQTRRWTSDNCWAYLALKAASKWAFKEGDMYLYNRYKNSLTSILNGINNYLKDRNSPVWYQAIDENGNPHNTQPASWINYAPVMLNIPVGCNLREVGNWIHSNLQQSDGSCIGYDSNTTRKYPGLTFQTCIAWNRTNQIDYSNNGFNWIIQSGLWQLRPDSNNVRGGFIDWIDLTGNTAPSWQRFIDTSFYAIAVLTCGYRF